MFDVFAVENAKEARFCVLPRETAALEAPYRDGSPLRVPLHAVAGGQ